MVYVGIDVAKDKHDCFITNSDGEFLFRSFTIPNPDKPEKFILYISPLCYSKEKGGFPLCYLRINTSIKFTASLPVMTA